MQNKKHHYHFHIAATLLWVAAIPVVIGAYVYFPKEWLEVLGLSLSVGHIWSILAAHLNAIIALHTDTRQGAIYENDNTNSNVVTALDTSGVECETTTVWA